MAFLPILFKIQEIETALNQLIQRENAAKQDQNYIALKMLGQNLEAAIKNLEQELTQSQSLQFKTDLELKNCLEHMADEEQKLYSGKISSPRELEQIQQKVLEYQKAKDKLEEELLNLMDSIEKKTAELKELTDRYDKCTQEIQVVKKGISQKLLEIKMDKTDLEDELKTLVVQIAPDWLERYRRIAKSHRGVGIVKVKQKSCGGCHVSLSESLLQKIKQGEDRLNFCENCGRILYY